MTLLEKPQDLTHCLLSYYSLRGQPPPDSCLDLSCACGYEGVFDIPCRGAFFKKSRLSLRLACPKCGDETPISLGLGPRYRLAAFFNGAKRACKNALKARRKLWISAGILTTLLAVAALEYAPMEGWRILKEEGPAAAIQWVKDPRTDREKIIRAWSFYSNGGHEEAEALAKDLFARKKVSKEKADALYLSALIDSRRGGGYALEYFQRAEAYYRQLGKWSSLFQVQVSTANHYAALDDPETATIYLDRAEDLLPQISSGSANLAYFYETEAEVFFRAEMYEHALEASVKSLDLYGKSQSVIDQNGVARALGNTAFFQVLLGDYQSALQNLVEAESLVLNLGNQRQFYYNKLTYYLLYKCMGFEAAPYYVLLEHRARTDALLKSYLDFVERFACGKGIQYKGDGTAPAPPPDQQ